MRKLIVILLLAATAALGGCGKKKRVIIFHADALTVPMKRITAAYQKLHPDVWISAESHGSKICAKLAKQRACDILMVADARIIREMQPEYAQWNAIFATNEIVIAYADKSKYGSEINSDNWYEILARPDVKFAHADPELDPCGYWTLITWKLADLHYADTLNGKPVSEALMAARTDESIKHDAHMMLNLISSPSGIDYCFVYKNQVVEQNLKLVTLPDEINLSNPELAELYGKARITDPVDVTGSPISFSLTLLKKAPEPDEAVKFLKFFLGPEGRKLLKGNRAEAAFNVLHPPRVDDRNNMPLELRKAIDAGGASVDITNQ